MIALAPTWHPLNIIDEYLLVRGWTHTASGWVAPPEWQEPIHERFGGGIGGAWQRSNAVRFQVLIDERIAPRPSAATQRLHRPTAGGWRE